MRRVIIIFLVVATAAGCSDEGGLAFDRTSRQPVISEGIDPLLQTLDYNVLTHRELVDNAEFAGTARDELRVWNAATAARTVALQVNPVRNTLVGGSCERNPERGNGFLTGYGSLVATHHTDYEDSPFTAYRFGFPDTIDGVDEHFSRRRAYRLGLLAFATPQIVPYPDFEEQILNWKFTNYAPGDWYTRIQRDAVLKVTTDPKCLTVDDGGVDPNVRLFGPGMFFDWLDPASFDGELALEEGQETFIGHVNSLLRPFGDVAPLYDPVDEIVSLDHTADPDDVDLWNLGSLPGYMGGATACGSIDVDCIGSYSQRSAILFRPAKTPS